MKVFLLLIGIILGSVSSIVFYDNHPAVPCELNKNAIFILESVQNDTMLQSYILDPGYRVRVKEAESKLK